MRLTLFTVFGAFFRCITLATEFPPTTVGRNDASANRR